MNDDNLDLRVREPAPGARVAAVPPGHVRQVGGDVLLLTPGGGVRASELVKAETVKGVGVGIEGVIEADGVRGDADLGVGGDDEAVGEAEVFAYEPLVGYWEVGWSEGSICGFLIGQRKFGLGGGTCMLRTEEQRVEALAFAHEAV